MADDDTQRLFATSFRASCCKESRSWSADCDSWRSLALLCIVGLSGCTSCAEGTVLLHRPQLLLADWTNHHSCVSCCCATTATTASWRMSVHEPIPAPDGQPEPTIRSNRSSDPRCQPASDWRDRYRLLAVAQSSETADCSDFSHDRRVGPTMIPIAARPTIQRAARRVGQLRGEHFSIGPHASLPLRPLRSAAPRTREMRNSLRIARRSSRRLAALSFDTVRATAADLCRHAWACGCGNGCGCCEAGCGCECAMRLRLRVGCGCEAAAVAANRLAAAAAAAAATAASLPARRGTAAANARAADLPVHRLRRLRLRHAVAAMLRLRRAADCGCCEAVRLRMRRLLRTAAAAVCDAAAAAAPVLPEALFGFCGRLLGMIDSLLLRRATAAAAKCIGANGTTIRRAATIRAIATATGLARRRLRLWLRAAAAAARRLCRRQHGYDGGCYVRRQQSASVPANARKSAMPTGNSPQQRGERLRAGVRGRATESAAPTAQPHRRSSRQCSAIAALPSRPMTTHPRQCAQPSRDVDTFSGKRRSVSA